MAGMNVDFNNVRTQACYSYDSLVEKLNRAILKNDQYASPNDVHGDREININGYVLIDREDIQKDLDNLRSLIGAIAMTYEPDSEEFKDVFSEIYPGDDDHMESFNDEEE